MACMYILHTSLILFKHDLLRARSPRADQIIIMPDAIFMKIWFHYFMRSLAHKKRYADTNAHVINSRNNMPLGGYIMRQVYLLIPYLGTNKGADLTE